VPYLVVGLEQRWTRSNDPELLDLVELGGAGTLTSYGFKVR